MDDHTLVLRGLAHVVRQCLDGVDVQEAGSAQEAMESLEAEPADVALVDVRMPERDGLDLLKDIKARWPALPVIILTTYDDSRYVKAALAEGAAGYMLKDASPDDLAQAIRVAVSGAGNVLSARAIRSLFEERTGGGEEGERPRRPENLTQRELDILALLAEGRGNREISRRLYLSEKTVKAHLASVFRKLGVTNRTQAAMAAVSMGLGPGGEDRGAEPDAASGRR